MTKKNVGVRHVAGLCLAATVMLPTAAPAQGGTARPAADSAPATPIATSYPAAADGDGGGAPGTYALSRWAEDWTLMRDPARRRDAIDRLKFLPLDEAGDIYLTLSGEVRFRVNHTTNPNLRAARAQRQDINRLVAGADLHVGSHLRAYAEVAHGGISGVELGAPAATLRNDLVLQQAFVEGDATVGDVEIGARYGRQEFTDGSNLLVSQRDNNTIRYTVNGGLAWVRNDHLRADIFDLKPTAYGDLGTEDDIVDPARRFSGVTLGIVVPPTWFGASKLYLDPFLWRRRNSVGAWGGRIGPATRYYGGARLWGDVGKLTIGRRSSPRPIASVPRRRRRGSGCMSITPAAGAAMAMGRCATPMRRSATTSITAIRDR